MTQMLTLLAETEVELLFQPFHVANWKLKDNPKEVTISSFCTYELFTNNKLSNTVGIKLNKNQPDAHLF
jgi:hypothetical protein